MEAINYIKEKQKEYYEGTVTHNAIRELEVSLPQIIERDFQSHESLLKEEVERLSERLENQIKADEGLLNSKDAKIQEIEHKNKELREVLSEISKMLDAEGWYPATVEAIEKLLKQ